jgi:hypothetical protein
MSRLLAVVLTTLVLVSCAPNVDVTKTSKGFNAQTDPNNVEVLMTKPDRKFVELGSVSTAGWSASDTAKMHNALRAKAAPLGADAVIIISSGLVPTGSFGGMKMWVNAVAIKYQ